MATDRPREPERARTGPGRVLAGLAAAVIVAASFSACDDAALGLDGGSDGDSPPEQAPSADLTFLSPADDAPDLLLGDSDGDGIPDTTFVATAGEDLRVEVYYQDPDDEPGEEGDRFLRFELDDESLLRYPEDHPNGRGGEEFADGDTVHITLQVAGDTLLAEFGPSGLEFDPEEPAELEMRWIEADRDTDDDGEEDLDDREEDLDLWKQEQPGEQWQRLDAIAEDLELDRVEVEVRSFTRFAMAI